MEEYLIAPELVGDYSIAPKLEPELVLFYIDSPAFVESHRNTTKR